MPVKKIAVIGAGLMGRQIALKAALSGFNTCLNDISQEALEQAKSFAIEWMNARVKQGKMSAEQAHSAEEHLSFSLSLEEAASDADLIIEAVVERLDVKRSLFASLDGICPSHCILATNSSYIVSSKIADTTKRPEKVVNMHFFNPALVMKLVEVVRGPHVAEETIQTVVQVSEAMDKVPVVVNKEIYGFIANRIFTAITKEALYLLDIGVVSAEDIDKAVIHGLGHPMGPMQLLDLVGIDLEYTVRMERYRETQDPLDKPSPAIVERYAQGHFGRKTGQGFYSYKK